MNKKFLCSALACLMALSTVFPMTACKGKPDDTVNNGGNSGEGGGNNNGNNGGNNGENNGGNNNGGNNNGGNNNGGNNNGGNNNEGGDLVIEPGTVIQDEVIKKQFLSSVSQAKLSGFSYSASANISVSAGEAAQTQKIVAEGSVLLSESISADVCAYVESASGEEADLQYLLCFIRDGYAYSAQGDWSGEDEVDFAALKAQLKAEKDQIILNREQLSGEISAILNQPAAVKILKNLPTLGEGTLTKTEGGFFLEIGILDTIESILEGISTLAGAIDKNLEITLGGLFAEAYFKTTAEKLLEGVTAEEMKELIEAILPQEHDIPLPEAKTGATAVSYVEGLLRSGAFYTAVTGGEDAWEEYKTFSEVPFKHVLGMFMGEEFNLEENSLKDIVDDFKDELKTNAVSLLLGLIELDGELSDEEFEITMGFSFGDDKELLGFSLEGFVEGKMTAAPTEENEEDAAPEEDTESASPEENTQGTEPDGSESGDETQSEEGSTEEEALENATGTGQKTTARGTVKLEAASVSAPELFDLVGCRYYTSDGETAKISAKK